MKKFGFTLAETLITLAIVGIIAAIMLPMVNKFKPDSKKATFLNVYDSLTSVINNAMNNDVIYPFSYIDASNTEKLCEEAPFYNLTEVTVDGVTYGQTGNDKFCQVIADYFDSYNNANCTTAAVTNNNFSTVNFEIKNNVKFYITTLTTPYFVATVQFDINGEERPNCMYNAATPSSCTDPDRFKFFVSGAGDIVAADPMSQRHILTRANMRKMELKGVTLPAAKSIPASWASIQPKNL